MYACLGYALFTIYQYLLFTAKQLCYNQFYSLISVISILIYDNTLRVYQVSLCHLYCDDSTSPSQVRSTSVQHHYTSATCANVSSISCPSRCPYRIYICFTHDEKHTRYTKNTTHLYLTVSHRCHLGSMHGIILYFQFLL